MREAKAKRKFCNKDAHWDHAREIADEILEVFNGNLAL